MKRQFQDPFTKFSKMSMFSGFTNQISGWVATKTGGQAPAEEDPNAQQQYVENGAEMTGEQCAAGDCQVIVTFKFAFLTFVSRELSCDVRMSVCSCGEKDNCKSLFEQYLHFASFFCTILKFNNVC